MKKPKPLDWSQIPEEQRPKHYLFMSFDAINSTEMKTSFYNDADDSQHHWLALLLDFLPETQVMYASKFNEQIKNCAKRNNGSCQKKCVAPEVWKFIGDEVILKTTVMCQEQLYANIKSMVNVLDELNKKNTEGGSKLAFKGTAWVAGFPNTNVEIVLPTDKEKKDNTIIDYVGPSIDIGFRLSKFATKSRLIISASLAFFLHEIANSSSLARKNNEEEALSIYSSGFVEIKGVKDGRQPLFWVSTHSEDDLEKELLEKVDQTKLTRFFGKYYEKDNPPFIFSILDTQDNSYMTKYNKTTKILQKMKYTIFGKTNIVNRKKPIVNKEEITERLSQSSTSHEKK